MGNGAGDAAVIYLCECATNARPGSEVGMSKDLLLGALGLDQKAVTWWYNQGQTGVVRVAQTSPLP